MPTAEQIAALTSFVLFVMDNVWDETATEDGAVRLGIMIRVGDPDDEWLEYAEWFKAIARTNPAYAHHPALQEK